MVCVDYPKTVCVSTHHVGYGILVYVNGSECNRLARKSINSNEPYCIFFQLSSSDSCVINYIFFSCVFM